METFHNRLGGLSLIFAQKPAFRRWVRICAYICTIVHSFHDADAVFRSFCYLFHSQVHTLLVNKYARQIQIAFLYTLQTLQPTSTSTWNFTCTAVCSLCLPRKLLPSFHPLSNSMTHYFCNKMVPKMWMRM